MIKLHLNAQCYFFRRYKPYQIMQHYLCMYQTTAAGLSIPSFAAIGSIFIAQEPHTGPVIPVGKLGQGQ